jgi:hypothetical protein
MENNIKYKTEEEGMCDKLVKLVKFLFWDAVPESDLR